MYIPARKISTVSLLIAMSIVLTRVASIRIAIGGVEGIRIGFGKFPIILAGFMLGPFYGGIVGAVSDVIGYLIQPMGPYMPHFSVISAITGILPPLLYRSCGENDYSLIKTFFTIGGTIVITELFMIPYALHIIFDIPWNILLLPRLISTPLTSLLYTYTLHLFLSRNIIHFVHSK